MSTRTVSTTDTTIHAKTRSTDSASSVPSSPSSAVCDDPDAVLDVAGTDPGVVAFYTHRVDEADRLSGTRRGRLEAIRVRELLTRWLPEAPGPVADVGGGPGVHAAWLAEAGYAVDLLDPVPKHVDAARCVGVRKAVVGDARNLPWENATYVLTLVAGPLYHLPATARKEALTEAVRITKPGGVIAAVATNRYANLIGSAIANQFEARRRVVGEILTEGYTPANDRVPHMYYHTPEQLADELKGAGLADVHVHGLSGPGGWLTVALERHFAETNTPLPDTLTSPDPLHTALEVARLADDYPAMTPMSAQLMAFGRVSV